MKNKIKISSARKSSAIQHADMTMTLLIFHILKETCQGRKLEIPDEFVQVGSEYYLISEEKMPWPQAQYQCMNQKGQCFLLFS